MLQLPLYYVTIVLLLLGSSYAQLDPLLCPNGPSSNIPDPKWSAVPPRFEIITELVSFNSIMELSQAFSPARDAITTSSVDGAARFYWSFATSERFTVVTAIINSQAIPVCLRQVLDGNSQTSVVQPNTLVVKPSVLLGYNERNQPNPNWGTRYVNSTILRGIATNVFQSCFFVSDIGATVSATYYASDPLQFQPNARGNQSALLQIDVKVKSRTGSQDEYQYFVFRYLPNPRRREERQALETPTGLYCPNRTSTLNLPENLPERLSANNEAALPLANGSILSTHTLYDTEFQLTRVDFWFADPKGSLAWGHFTEIHDFATGLSYQYDYTNRQCSVRNISQGLNDVEQVDGKPNLVEMVSPQHLFLLDDVSYQYTGEKRCRDRVWCHVWIAEKSLPGDQVEHREWYWAASINDEPLVQWIPIKLIVKTYAAGVLISNLETTVFNFRQNPYTIYEVDFTLADCYRALGPAEDYNIAVLSFKIANEQNYPILDKLNYFRQHVWQALALGLFVRPIRLSNIVVDREDKNIVVTFTLLDAPPRTGSVENPIREPSLDRLVSRLNSLIDDDELAFRARYGSKQVVLRAVPQSLNVEHRSTEVKVLHTGPRITGMWFGFIFAGLVVGAIVSFFVFKKMTQT